MAAKIRFPFVLFGLPALWTVCFLAGIRGPAVFAVPANPPAAEEEDAFRILLGLTDTKSTPWDGTISAAPGELVRLEPWRFDLEDRLEGTAGWKLSTHPIRLFGAAQGAQRPVVANGVIAVFRNLAPTSEIRVDTAQGRFQFRPSELPYGKSVKSLDGRVMVDRVPVSRPVVQAAGEQDFPAAAVDENGDVWLAYAQFLPNPKFTGIRMALQQPPANMAELAEPPVGDQIMLARCSGGKWSEPIILSEGSGDLYRPAVAIDGSRRIWVFWSANQNGNFDIYARALEAGKPGRVYRLTTDRGADIDPVAATDAQGRVWVAWQAFRGSRGQIHAATQQRSGFSSEMTVASSSANEWNPAIAASGGGEVAIAWDSYRAGNYDVLFRTFDRAGRPGPEKTAAATARYEAYPTLAYDPSGRLWIAWEESGESWGKDFGAYETTGIALYQGRWIRVRVWQGDNVVDPVDPGTVLPGVPNRSAASEERQGNPWEGKQPDPELATNRAPSRVPAPPPRPMNSYPRLHADRSGRIWLAYRTRHPIWWTSVGTVWFENVISYDGAGWSNPVFVPHSDNLLDNRPALVSLGAGDLLMIGSSDGRQAFVPRLRVGNDPGQKDAVEQDPYSNDLHASRLRFPAAVQGMKLTPAAAAEAAALSGAEEKATARRLRDYRLRLGGAEYRILRGEFHRHTEVSMDGGNDGSLREAWRYAMDAASLDWVGCCDHDNGFGREYSWWLTQKLSTVFTLSGSFISMYSYERSVAYPEGHRNVVFAQRGVRTLPRLMRIDEKTPGSAPDTRMLYDYLRRFNGIVASHTSGTNMGTDWRDNNPLREPVVEIYQGDRQNYEMPDAPRSNSEKDSIGGWRPKGFVSLALEMGYRLGFESSSDHISTHMSYCNLYVTSATREGLLEAFQKRHVYGATDDILADVRSGVHMMGDEFSTSERPSLTVRLEGTAPFARVFVIKDSRHVYTVEPKTARVEFAWQDTAAVPGKTSYYYVRGEQEDGELVWASPMWITFKK